jgi:hypothetical protein
LNRGKDTREFATVYTARTDAEGQKGALHIVPSTEEQLPLDSRQNIMNNKLEAQNLISRGTSLKGVVPV